MDFNHVNNGHTDLLKKNKNRVQLECHVPPTSMFSIGFEEDVGSWEVDVTCRGKLSAAFFWDWDFNRVKVGAAIISQIVVVWDGLRRILKTLDMVGISFSSSTKISTIMSAESDVKGIISNYLQNRVFHRCPETQKRLRRQISDLYFPRVLTQTRNSLVLKQSRGNGFAFYLRQDIPGPVINLDDHF